MPALPALLFCYPADSASVCPPSSERDDRIPSQTTSQTQVVLASDWRSIASGRAGVRLHRWASFLLFLLLSLQQQWHVFWNFAPLGLDSAACTPPSEARAPTRSPSKNFFNGELVNGLCLFCDDSLQVVQFCNRSRVKKRDLDSDAFNLFFEVELESCVCSFRVTVLPG